MYTTVSHPASADALCPDFICLVLVVFVVKSQKRLISDYADKPQEGTRCKTHLPSLTLYQYDRLVIVQGLNGRAAWSHASLRTCRLGYQRCSCVQRKLVIRGDVSVCIDGSMQPQRPQEGLAWEGLHVGCLVTTNLLECLTSRRDKAVF